MCFHMKFWWWVSFGVGNNVIVIIIEKIKPKDEAKRRNLHHWHCRFFLPLFVVLNGKRRFSVDSGVSIDATSSVWNFTFLLAHRIYLPNLPFSLLRFTLLSYSFYVLRHSTLNRSITMRFWRIYYLHSCEDFPILLSAWQITILCQIWSHLTMNNAQIVQFYCWMVIFRP